MPLSPHHGGSGTPARPQEIQAVRFCYGTLHLRRACLALLRLQDSPEGPGRGPLVIPPDSPLHFPPVPSRRTPKRRQGKKGVLHNFLVSYLNGNFDLRSQEFTTWISRFEMTSNPSKWDSVLTVYDATSNLGEQRRRWKSRTWRRAKLLTEPRTVLWLVSKDDVSVSI